MTVAQFVKIVCKEFSANGEMDLDSRLDPETIQAELTEIMDFPKVQHRGQPRPTAFERETAARENSFTGRQRNRGLSLV